MAQSTTVETDGVQIKVWIPAAFYDLLKAQAVHNQTSVAAEARRLMQAGLAPLGTLDEVKSDLTKLSQFARLHLEPLTFIAAMDAAAGREYWKNQTFFSAQKAGADDPDRATAEADRFIGERAAKRIQRKLRELEPKPDKEEGETDASETAKEDD